MKNVHLIATDKPSRVFYLADNLHLEMGQLITPKDYQNIYITNSEEIKEGDWYYLPRTNSVHKCVEDPTELNLERRLGVAKIIITTDQSLDGVQAIDDEFLEWFVKNPSCEEVKIESWKIDKEWDKVHTQFNPIYPQKTKYKIIIPKEEPKQETLEEVVNNFKKTDVYINEIKQEQERSYTIEDMENCWDASFDYYRNDSKDSGVSFEMYIQSLQQPKQIEVEVEMV